MPHPMTSVLTAVALSLPLALAAVPASAAPPTAPATPYDVNGDGDPELAATADFLTVDNHTGAGAVVVLPASKNGLSLDERLIKQSSSGKVKPADLGELFGFSVVSADFDADGYADLAAGQVAVDSGDASFVGSVTVLYGSPKGLTSARSEVLTRPGTATDFEDFGWSVAAADLNGDGFADLAVGAPGDDEAEEQCDHAASGTVTVFSGSKDGLRTAGARVLHGERGAKAHDVQFGARLATGDVDGDGDPDLVVASSGESFGDHGNGYTGYAGSVSYCPSGGQGPTVCRRLVHRDTYAGVNALGVANVNGSGRAEIVLGVPAAIDQLDHPKKSDPGKVVVLGLAGSGTVTVSRTLTITQGSKGVPGSNERGDGFGFSLALGDLDRDGYADLVIGAPTEDDGHKEDAGRVTVVHGARSGYRTKGNRGYDQGTKGIPGKVEAHDVFGWGVTLVDHDADGHLDLAVGAPADGDGAVTTLRGSGRSFTTKGARTFGLDTLGIPTAGSAPGFGSSFGQ